MSVEDNKGYKFKFEFTETEHYDDEHGTGSSNFKFVTCGDTAKEAIEGHEALLDVWDKFLEKNARGPYRDRRKLK